MKKHLLTTIALCFSASLFASEISCETTKVNNLSLGDGFYGTNSSYSESGTTGVTLSEDTIELGRVEISKSTPGTKISRRTKRNTITTVFTQKEKTLMVKYYKKSKLGVILLKEKNEKKFQLLTTLDCNDHSKTLTYLEQADIDKLKPMKKLSKSLTSKMVDFELGFEFGDGYYDLTQQDFYKVKKGRKLVGYVVFSELSYTEDDENEYAYDFFAPSGVRLSSPERY